jgi:hypothetical protein
MQLSCTGGSTIPTENSRLASDRNGTTTIVNVTIPAGCTTQQLALWLDSDKGDAGPILLRQVSAERQRINGAR